PGPTAETYEYGNESSLSSGFISGLNTIDFYVEGNGVTDGFELRKVSFTARESSAVPEPATMLLLGFGLVGLAGVRKRFSN
ncbi:MAG TPA: PEP-CTERM sorting domain-containing protein, partial [Syntrophales bacterium]